MAINAGKLRHVVRFEQRSTTQDAAGEQINTWVPVATRRAEIVRTPGRELFASNERQGRVPTLFRLRPIHAVTVVPAMRLICNSKVFNVISAIDPEGMGAEMVVTAEELVEEVP